MKLECFEQSDQIPGISSGKDYISVDVLELHGCRVNLQIL